MPVARPGGAMATRPLHFIWIVDCSGSMQADGKIQALNSAIRETIPHMQSVARENPNAAVLVRALTFSTGAQWHVSQPTPVTDFRWEDVQAGGVTDMGTALSMVADQLQIPPMTDRALPPVLVLLSDGQPTDDYNTGLRRLLGEQWGRKAVRVAIAIGGDADLNVLQKFIDHPELRPLLAGNPEALVNHIKWASTAVLKTASSPAVQAPAPAPDPAAANADPNAAAPAPDPGWAPASVPAPPPADTGDDVW